MMKRFMLKHLFSYSERALTPKIYSELLHQKISNHSMPEIMHNLNLFDNSIQLFDYDYYNKISIKILDYQNKMSTHDILTVLRLGVKHNVKNQFLWKHLEGELHRRLHNALNSLIEHEKKQAINHLQSVAKKFESASQDYFQILASKQQQNQSKPEQKANFKITDTPNIQSTGLDQFQNKPLAIDIDHVQHKLVSKLQKKEILQQIQNFVEVLAWFGCTDSKFLTLLLETFIHPQLIKKAPSTILRTAQLLVYTCQINMKQYSSNKNKYTGRSIKRIYKYQGYYFSEILSSVKQMINEFSDEQIRYITDVIGGFPLKKRKHRMQFASLICNQWSKRGGLPSQENKKLEQILAKDQKLITRFKQIVQKIEQSNHQKVANSQQETISFQP